MNLILVEPSEVDAGGLVSLDGDRARHIVQVLKAGIGQTVRVGVTDGGMGVGTVLAIAGRVTLQCEIGDPPPQPRVDLLLALPRPKVMRRLWAQLAAIGVGRIILTNAERVERNYFDTHVLGPGCYRPLLIEGLQQARDTHVPRVSIHRQFLKLIEDELDPLAGTATRIVADPLGTRPIREAAPRQPGARLLLAVGPEGGWNTFELSLLDAHGFTRAGMGPRTLRSDTACISLLTLANEAIRGDEIDD